VIFTITILDSKLYLEVFIIDIRHLEYFVAVPRQKSYSKAAIISLGGCHGYQRHL